MDGVDVLLVEVDEDVAQVLAYNGTELGVSDAEQIKDEQLHSLPKREDDRPFHHAGRPSRVRALL